MQLLYMYAGMLAINATINSAPLDVVTRIAKVGAVSQVLGQLLLQLCCSSKVLWLCVQFLHDRPVLCAHQVASKAVCAF